jgi:hypothetical protein
MIVRRATFNVKQGCMQEFVALVLAEGEKVGPPNTRVYTPYAGPRDVLAIKWEFENLEAHDKFWTDWWARPETATFLEKWYELTERGGTDELGNLAQR